MDDQRVPPYSRLEVRDLFNIIEHLDDMTWEPFRHGVDIHRLYGNSSAGPSAALLRFRETVEIPLHAHPGYEHLIVLAGSQRDQNGPIGPGTLVVNPPGTRHRVISEAGCVVLAIYEKAVEFLGC